jgi:hypothetical protein|tara:strand:+ start:35 stop:181 length:147 start_codon:yes stop_codon:yes gene_type:complete
LLLLRPSRTQAKRNRNEYFAHARYRKEKKAQLNLALAIKKNLTEQING